MEHKKEGNTAATTAKTKKNPDICLLWLWASDQITNANMSAAAGAPAAAVVEAATCGLRHWTHNSFSLFYFIDGILVLATKKENEGFEAGEIPLKPKKSC